MEIDHMLEMIKERAELHRKMKQNCEYESKLSMFHEGAMIALINIQTMIQDKLNEEEK